jgi:predicted nuclease of predicted toxin-antitoxin system
MKFIVDAQLPRHLAASLKWWGHDALHTLDLLSGNRTPDWRINEISMEEQRVLITKDADFVNSLLLSGVPFKLLLVSTGNVNNQALEEIFSKNISLIIEALNRYEFVEITQTSLIEHR